MSSSELERKRLLIAQAAAFRHGFLVSRDAVRADLHPQALMQAALHQITGNAGAAVGSMFSLDALRNGNFRLLLPVLKTAIALVPMGGLLRVITTRRVLRLAAVAGVIAAGVYWWGRSRRGPGMAKNTDDSLQRQDGRLGREI
ncbi:MAG: hypothetical protein JWR21_2490 [Herminiimonas sp.]|nr:hypothetical protein [Herminiimonas sp.]MDB5852268.1 hypothetical protein [Herminiimonas sp.]